LISKDDFVVNCLSETSSLPGINSGSFTFNAEGHTMAVDGG